MRNQPTILALVLIAVSLCAGQTQGPDKKPQVNAAPEQAATQATTPPPEIPTFYANSRQVMVEAEIWNKVRKKGDDSGINPTLPPAEQAALRRLPPPVHGLMAKDFHVFDNGVEQKINYFRETDFPAVDTSGQWGFESTTGGTWRYPPPPGLELAMPSATYLIGYAPLAMQADECHSISVVVVDRDVHANRSRYCAPSSSGNVHDTGALLGTNLGARMLQFGNSQERGAIKVKAQAFTFWSSGVLRLATQSSSSGADATLTPTDYTYVVEVHDSRAPARVQLSAAFKLRKGSWYHPCQSDEVLYILGVASKTTGEVAGQFTDSLSCQMGMAYLPKATYPAGYGPMPSIFDGQIDLPPGQYNLRIVVSDRRHFGRAQIALRVDQLNPRNLTISDVMVVGVLREASWVLREAAAVSPFPVVPTPLVSKGIQFFPDSDVPPRLAKSSPLYLYFEVYQPAQEKPATAIFYTVRITDLKSASLVMNTGPMSAADWVMPGNAATPIGLKLATAKLPAGSYKLEIQASDTSGRQTEWRRANFDIE